MKTLFPDLPNPLVVIIGPTAVGKTEFAVRLAEQVGGEIVSADSRLLYVGMDIGTAKPTQEEQQVVPHHLIDVAAPDQVWSLSLFKQAAEEAISDIQERHRLPFLVGGTGQYVHALLEDWTIPAQEPDTRLRKALEAWGREIGPFELHRRLAVLDPEASLEIQPQNVRRTIRALEVIFLTGRRFSQQRQQRGSPYSRLVIGLKRPRAELFRRIDDRIEQMIAGGLVEEVQALLDAGYPTQLPTLSAIGYQEIAAYLSGAMTLEEAITQMKRLTHQFVRRQANWFKENDPNIHWLEAGDDDNLSRGLALLADPKAWIPPDQNQAQDLR